MASSEPALTAATSLVDGIKTDENNLAIAPGSLGGLDSTQDHLIVVSESTGDLRVSLQDILEHRPSFGAAEVSSLAGGDRRASAVQAHEVVKALAALAGG